MNIDHLDHNLLTNNYTNLLYQLVYAQYIKHPTRIADSSSDLTINKTVPKTYSDHIYLGNNKSQVNGKAQAIVFRTIY